MPVINAKVCHVADWLHSSEHVAAQCLSSCGCEWVDVALVYICCSFARAFKIYFIHIRATKKHVRRILCNFIE
ncbi:hypothetical protein SK128_014171 [Halocaridina rubra]|uniref:Uncharacterized protein n=1 Tax=Halocaridina rubra TaxID=373956 RepID=A0AAN9A247_HALRR